MSSLEIFDFPQGSPEWWQARMGLCTASEFATVLAKGKNGEPSKTRATYLHKLAGERLTGEPMESYNNQYLERGKILEGEARDLYAFVSDAELCQVGFVRNGSKGCSPDALIADDGGLEIKTCSPHLLIPILLKGEFPPDHRAQVQGNMWVTERAWWDLAIYFPKMPLFVKRAFRDDAYIAMLESAVDQFNDELAAIVEKVRGMREAA